MSKYGPYVVRRPRKKGTSYYFQSFHRHLRPPGFQATFPLYVQTEPGEPTAEELERILQRAEVNYEEYRATREAVNPTPPPRDLLADGPQNTWSALADQLVNSFWFEGLSVHSQAVYRAHYAKIAAAFDGRPEMHPGVITQGLIEQWLRRRGYSAHTVITWGISFNRLLERAAVEGLRPHHQPIRLKVKRKLGAPIRLWTQSDVEAICATFEAKEDFATSELIQIAWATGQRLTDIRQLKFGVDYVDGQLHFLTNKTGARILLTVSPELRERLDARFRQGALMFPSPRRRLFTNTHLSEYYRDTTRRLEAYRDAPLKLRTLRHSAVLHFARSGCTIPMIASVTGHSLNTVHQILEHYLPRDPILAAQAQAMRARSAGVFGAEPMIEGAARTFIGDLARPQKPTAEEPPRYV